MIRSVGGPAMTACPRLRALLPFKRWRDPAPVVAVVPLAGVIGGVGMLRRGLTLSGLAETLERAFKLKRAKAVALLVNSPGGSPVQSAQIAGRIRALAEEHKRPVFAFAEDVAASGGYWLLTAGDEIWADESSIVGSIGVVAASFGFPEALRRLGIERRVYTSGTQKAALDPFQPERTEEVEHLKHQQEAIHEAFRRQVRDRRSGKLKASEEELFNGRFWCGRSALELGLVDGLGDLRSTMREKYGERVRFAVITSGRRWWQWRPWQPATGRSHGSNVAEAHVSAALAVVEERLLWHRYGL